MKKILALIGSPDNAKSNTATMTRDFLESVTTISPDVEWELISLGENRVDFCHGCWACMRTGQCIRRDDSLAELRQKVLEADLLIFGTPVYEQHISAQMKAFFDRTFMWIHLVGLLGKPALTAITTGGDGLRSTQRYLSGVISMMGCIVVGHVRGIGQQPGCFPDRAHCKSKFLPLAGKVAAILEGRRRIRPRLFNIICFEIMKHHARRSHRASQEYGSNHTEFEHRYWAEKGWLKSSYGKALAQCQRCPAGQAGGR